MNSTNLLIYAPHLIKVIVKENYKNLFICCYCLYIVHFFEAFSFFSSTQHNSCYFSNHTPRLNSIDYFLSSGYILSGFVLKKKKIITIVLCLCVFNLKTFLYSIIDQWTLIIAPILNSNQVNCELPTIILIVLLLLLFS